jgi:hypothetical protein
MSLYDLKGGNIWQAIRLLITKVDKIQYTSAVINPTGFNKNLQGENINNPQELADAVDQLNIGGGGGGAVESVNGNLPDISGNVTLTIPTQLSQLTDDSTHRIVTDTEKTTWNAKLSSYIETDPVFVASQAHNITSTHIAILNNTSNTNTGDETGARISIINHAASVKTNIVDADEVTGQDSAATFGLIRTTWASIKAFLKTYFDGIYSSRIICYSYVISDMSSDIAVGSKITDDWGFGFTVTEIYAKLKVAAVGALFTIDIKKNGTTVFSTKLTFDSTELTTRTAATPYVLTSAPLIWASNDIIEITVDVVGVATKGQGCIVKFLGYNS